MADEREGAQQAGAWTFPAGHEATEAEREAAAFLEGFDIGSPSMARALAKWVDGKRRQTETALDDEDHLQRVYETDPVLKAVDRPNDATPELPKDIATGRRQEVLNRLCNMMDQAWKAIDPNGHEPCNCVCTDRGLRYQNAGHALEFMQEAISGAINRLGRERAPQDYSEALSYVAVTARELLEWGWDTPEHLDWTEVRIDLRNLRAALDRLANAKPEGGRGDG